MELFLSKYGHSRERSFKETDVLDLDGPCCYLYVIDTASFIEETKNFTVARTKGGLLAD